jgi:hypothetical protein
MTDVVSDAVLQILMGRLHASLPSGRCAVVSPDGVEIWGDEA